MELLETGGDLNSICFIRITQISVLRLLTTPAVMNDKPLTMSAALSAYDRLFEDDRVTFIPEPVGVDSAFRGHAIGATAAIPPENGTALVSEIAREGRLDLHESIANELLNLGIA